MNRKRNNTNRREARTGRGTQIGGRTRAGRGIREGGENDQDIGYE